MSNKWFISFLLINCILVGCSNKNMKNATVETVQSSLRTNRTDKIDTSNYDSFPPLVLIDGWEVPQPLPNPIDKEGNELEPFITLAGDELYFLFTPDFSISEAKRALDGVSGIYYSKKVNGVWSTPEKLELGGDNALNGCVYTDGKTLWFCSMREGNYNQKGDYYTAFFVNGRWSNWQNAGELLNSILDIEEIHLSTDQNTMIFSAVLPDSHGYADLWQIQRVGESWSEPENLGNIVNSPDEETFPYLSEDGKELWFTSSSRLGYPGYAIFRSIWQDGEWGEPQEIISNYASEVSIDRQGNLYFTHFLYDENDELLGSKIYVAYKKTSTVP
jgi:hypothetical protein